jgi:putative sigma-54 modulation protein
MNLEFTGRHIEVTPALRAHAEEHFKKIEDVFDGKPVKAHIIIEVERGRHRSEIVMNWWNEVLTATSDNSDMYLSLSQTIDKIEKQARRLKEKVIDKAHKAQKASLIASPDDQAL